MSKWDTILFMVVIIAIVATIVGSKKAATAITALGTAFVQLTQNIVGVGPPKQTITGVLPQ